MCFFLQDELAAVAARGGSKEEQDALLAQHQKVEALKQESMISM